MPTLANVWDLIARDAGASATFNRVAASADRAAVATERAGVATKGASGKFGGLGKAIIGLGLADAGYHMAKMAGDFQQNTNVLVTAAGELPKNLATVRKGILDISVATGTTWQNITEGIYLAEKAGYRGRDALQLMKAAAQAAREEGAHLGPVAQAMTSIMASYHMSAKDSVMVANGMKTMAGEAKTTFEGLAASLSTVMPLASANKVNLADLGGILATLTQHGTSADQATQEMANSLRNLAAPNMVAVKMMAQLGISSVDVAQKLGDGPGGRGYAGTLKYIAQVVKQHTGPSGLILLSTLNASKVAAQDATIMLNKLSPASRKLAEEWIHGKITNGEYVHSVKDMDATQNTLSKQFAVTWRSAHGFQQGLRSGVAIHTTATEAIKKMTGGMNGLNVLLQTTGESMKGTEARSKAIADSMRAGGKDVSGWASTQKLFNVQFDMFKQQIDRVFIELGTKLLPVFSSVIGAVKSAIQWFDGLSSGWKTFAGDTLLVVVGLTAVSKIFKTIANSTLVGWASKIIASFTSVNVAAAESGLAEAQSAAVHAHWEAEKALASAEAAVKIAASLEGTNSVLAASATAAAESAIEFSASMQARADAALASATEIETALGAVTAAETEAGAASTIALGPLGLALAAIVGVVGIATHGFGLFGKSTKAAVGSEDDLTNAILKNNGALGANTRDIVKNKLEKVGAFDAALKFGIREKTLTDALNGNAAALKVVRARLGSYKDANTSMLDVLNRHDKKAVQLKEAQLLLSGALGDTTATMNASRVAAEHLAAADGRTLGATNSLSGGIANLTAILNALPTDKTVHINQITDYTNKYNSFHPHARGGFLNPGINLVGENGPELVDRATGMVTPAAQTSRTSGQAALIGEVQRLRWAVEQQAAQFADALNGTARTATHRANTMPAGRAW